MPLNVLVELGTVQFQRSQNPHEAAAQPYLWTVLFKIDDANGSGDPVATVIGTPGSHGNLGVGSVRAPSRIPVPSSIGRWKIGLSRLPTRQGTFNDAVGAIVGVIAVLLEEDNVSDEGAEAGRRELRQQVKIAVDAIAADLTSLLRFDAVEFADTIRSRVADAIKAEQNILENLWSVLDKDDFIGVLVWQAFYDDLDEAAAPLTFSEQMSSPFADWSLDGQASTFTESLLSFSRTALNFGSVRSGLTSSRRFTISNFTNEDVALALNKTGSDRFRLSTSTVALSRSREASVEVTFVAAGPGAANGSVAVKPQGSNATLATIPLAGSTPSGPAP